MCSGILRSLVKIQPQAVVSVWLLSRKLTGPAATGVPPWLMTSTSPYSSDALAAMREDNNPRSRL
jgi:hypothetical protein